MANFFISAIVGDINSKKNSVINTFKKHPLYNLFNEELKSTNVPISTGIFGADMKVSLLNDGPVTIIIER